MQALRLVVLSLTCLLAACSGPPGPDDGQGGGSGGSASGGQAGGSSAGPGGAAGGSAAGGVAGGDGGGGVTSGGSAGGLSGGGAGGGVVDAGAPVDLCPAAEARCVGSDRRRFCGATPGGLRWLDETCPAGSGCVRGACAQGACSDECDLGTRDGGRSCQLYDLTARAWVIPDAGASLHDRARDYNRWLRRDGMRPGSVGNARYSDPPTYSNITRVDGIGDSALWTGTYLAAEALRLQATGAPDARANVRSLVERVHLLMAVSGAPGNLARYAKLTSFTPPFSLGDHDCSNRRVHCDISFGGARYDYIGHVSRDQYQGVMLGYALAWDALGSEDQALKDLIRADVVTFVKELMTERRIALSITLNGVTMPTTMVNARFMTVNPAELTNGALTLSASTSGGGDGEMWGFQEFYPDLAHLVREVPGLSWVPSIPRASSAIMLASFFQVALHMTGNDPRVAADHAAISAYYTSRTGTGGNVTQWLAVAQQWTAGTGCNQTYYANNIMMEPLYNLARLETDPGRRATIHGALFTNRIWPAFLNAKNPFFSFIYAGTVSGVAPAVTTSATQQLAQFPPPPRVYRPVDLRSDPRYPRDGSCPDQLMHSMAVDVGERVVSDFIWQRDPWQLYDAGDLQQTAPGVDYLVAYWLGRKHGFITDDTPGKCLRLR
ncbi:MAG: hypothetical protein JNJ54_16860 [Myxococcaceae bacterium]|nr:hypothetical protein [Myxococcaceae bacterium]